MVGYGLRIIPKGEELAFPSHFANQLITQGITLNQYKHTFVNYYFNFQIVIFKH